MTLSIVQRLWRLTLLLVASAVACRNHSNTAHASTDVYGLVTSGMRCSQGGAGAATANQMVCQYSVGDGLQFSIISVGADDAGIEFDRVLPNSPYRAAMSMKHGCVIVEPRTEKNATSLPQFAFVSPRTGKVYHTWQDCASGT
jgi:hypothetical protein